MWGSSLVVVAPEIGAPHLRALPGRREFPGEFTTEQDAMAKNQNTFEKRRREVEKKRKADEKRDRRRQKKDPTTNQVRSDEPSQEVGGPRRESHSSTDGS